jgi:predicted metal-dependent hydrolase
VIPYTVTQTKRKKTMQIFIEKDSVDVRAPESMELSKIKDILQSKISWIFTKQLILKERKPGIKITKKSFVYLGKPVPYSIKNNKESEKITHVKNQFIIHTRLKSPSLEKINRMYFQWLEKRYAAYIERKLDSYSKILQVKPKGYKIKQLQSKWGSATDSGLINLNIHLFKTPRKNIDYVILHELVHLRIKGHKAEFWTCLEKYMPDYEKRKLWLDENYVEILKN